MLVYVKGVQFANKGAQLMLLAIRERLQRARPDAELVLLPGPGSPYPERARLGAWQLLPLRRVGVDFGWLAGRGPAALRRRARAFGIVGEAELDAILDASGFAYGAPWPERALRYAAGELTRLARRGRPYLFLPQAFGPFPAGSRATRRFAAALPRAARIYVRDAESLAQLTALGPEVAARTRLCPDLTLSVPGDAAGALRWGVSRRSVLLVPNAEMLGPRNPDAAARAGYLPLLGSLAQTARAAGYEVRLLNHEGERDAELCALLARSAGGLDIINEPDPLAAKGVLGAAAVVVSSRFHACAAALSQGVACLATGWSHKYAALYADFGVRDWLLDAAAAPAAAATLTALLAAPDARAAALAARRADFAQQIEALWTDVLRQLAAVPPDRP